MANTYKLSQEGYEKMLEELKELKTTERKKAVERLAKARAMGDLSENSEYTAAREGLNFVDGKILELETILENIEIVGESKNENVVQIGDTVTLDLNGGEEVYKIVGEMEADITQGHISDNSPLGRALLGNKVGSKVIVDAPAGKVEYRILSVQ